MIVRSGLAVVLISISTGLYAQDKLARLSPAHRKWLQEEVVYIITGKEKDLFLTLETEDSRERFIEAFWTKRDPDPATLENEFKKEHYRRLDYANRILSRDSPRPGWKTDRGRMYIILGEPREKQSYDGSAEVVSIDHWFYQGETAKGLPPFFDLLFFKDRDIGEHRLYNPQMDGARALLRMGPFAPSDDDTVMRQLTSVSVDLARASASIDRGEVAEGREGRIPMGTGFTMAAIEKSPYRAVRTDYVDSYLKHGSRVSAEYSFNYVPSRGYVTILDGPRGTPFVHYSIEVDPDSFSLETDADRTKFYTTVDFSLEVRDRAGELIAVQDNPMYIELTASQFQQVSSSPFAYQDSFPLVPGGYKVSVILRNRATKQYSIVEKDLEVEMPEPKPAVASLVLGYRTESVPASSGYGTFRLGTTQVLPASEDAFTPADTLHVFAQVREARPDQHVRFGVANVQEKLVSRETKVGDYQGGPAVEAFPLTQLAPGDYRVTVELLDSTGASLSSKDSLLVISPRSAIPRAGLVYRRGFNPAIPGLLALAVGQQFIASNRLPEAEAALEEAVAANNPKLPMARFKLAGVLLASRETDRVLELLLPLKDSYPNEPEVVEGLGFAYYFKEDWGQAVTYFEQSRKLHEPSTRLLNALGESYEKLGRPGEAKEAFERSLQIDSNQPGIKEKVAGLPGKKP